MEREYGELQSKFDNVKSKLNAQYVANAQYKREIIAAAAVAKRPRDSAGTRGLSANDANAELEKKYWLAVAKVEKLEGEVKSYAGEVTKERNRSFQVLADRQVAQQRTKEANAALQTTQFNLKVVQSEVSSLKHVHEQLQNRNQYQQQASRDLALEAGADREVSAAMGRNVRAVEMQCAAAVKAMESAVEKLAGRVRSGAR